MLIFIKNKNIPEFLWSKKYFIRLYDKNDKRRG